MTLHSSALLAVLFSEPGYLSLVDQMLEADVLRIGAPTLAETRLVFESRRGRPRSAAGDSLLDVGNDFTHTDLAS